MSYKFNPFTGTLDISSTGGAGGIGNVVGPATATDNAIVRFDTTTGKLIQDSLLTITDSGKLTVPLTGQAAEFGDGTTTATYVSTNGTRARFGMDANGAYLYGGASRAISLYTNAAVTPQLTVDTAGLVGIGTTAPTHSLTLPSTSTGIALYNTSDQTTNYERSLARYNSSVLEVGHFYGGTASTRAARFGTSTVAGATALTRYIQIQGVTPFISYNWSGSGLAGQMMNIGSGNTLVASSGNQTALGIDPTVTQTSTAGYTALLINPTETTTGSGVKLLADFQVGGTSKVKIKNDGVIFPVQAATASAPTYVLGGMYFDTTLNKLRIGGASAWETVTSV